MNLIDGEISKNGGALQISFASGLSVPIIEKPDAQIKEGQKIVTGLRTEDIFLDDGRSDFPDAWKFDVDAVITEPLGSETHMHVNANGIKITGKCEGRKVVHPREKITLSFNLKKLYIVDAASTKSIC